MTAAHTTTVSTAAAAPVSTTTATRRRCDTWGNRDRCTDCYGPDRAWLGISAPANFPSQGLMLIARSKTRCPLQRVGFGQRMLRRARTGKKSLLLSP